MLDAARDACSFVRGRDRADLASDRMLTYALFKAIEIIGEAASRIPPDGRAQYPSIPWHQVIGIRNRLIHAYSDVNLDIVWSTVQEDLPPLIAALEQLLPPFESLDAPGDE
jgi:uncharacterized protein with HEPN domain